MKANNLKRCALLAALMSILPPALSQSPPIAASTAVSPAEKTFSQQDLDTILAPIALYPDALLAQMFMAATYPLEVVQAARWVKENPKLSGKALEDALVGQPWDPAVKSLTAVPQVLQQMNDRLDWTQKLGDAFLAQQKEVMDTVQALRKRAAESGNLKTTEQQVVKTEQQESKTVYVIESPQPETVYVPTYNPIVVYGSWWYPSPPYYVYPPSYVYPPGLAFATGIFVGAAIWGNCNWGHGDVDVNVNRYNNFNRSNISNKNWNHNVDHRRGVAYQDRKVAQQYNRGASGQEARAREEFRGRAEAGRSELKGMDRNELGNRVDNANREGRDLARDGGGDRFGERGGFGDRGDFGGDRGGFGDRAGAGDRNGFSGVGNGAAARDAGSRGAASRSGFSGGGSRAGGGARGGGGGRGGRR